MACTTLQYKFLMHKMHVIVVFTRLYLTHNKMEQKRAIHKEVRLLDDKRSSRRVFKVVSVTEGYLELPFSTLYLHLIS